MIPSVKKWLEDQGFTLEMRVAAAFRAAGFEVRQASSYRDPETGKHREIDVLALTSDRIGNLEITLAIECKSTKKPWVLLSSPDTLDAFNLLFAFCVTSPRSRKAMVDHLDRCSDLLPWWRKDGLIGYSLRQAHSDVDVGYAASMSAAKAATSQVYADSNRDDERL